MVSVNVQQKTNRKSSTWLGLSAGIWAANVSFAGYDWRCRRCCLRLPRATGSVTLGTVGHQQAVVIKHRLL